MSFILLHFLFCSIIWNLDGPNLQQSPLKICFSSIFNDKFLIKKTGPNSFLKNFVEYTSQKLVCFSKSFGLCTISFLCAPVTEKIAVRPRFLFNSYLTEASIRLYNILLLDDLSSNSRDNKLPSHVWNADDLISRFPDSRSHKMLLISAEFFFPGVQFVDKNMMKLKLGQYILFQTSENLGTWTGYLTFWPLSTEMFYVLQRKLQIFLENFFKIKI